MSNLLFYVSGHGYGHAVRIAEVIRALRAVEPDINVVVRTTAPETLFCGDMPKSLRVLRANFGPGIVERGVFEIDWNASVVKLAEFLQSRESVIQSEAAWVRHHRIDRIIADIPFLAGEIADAADVPCIGISNFLWDWIYEPMLQAYDGGGPLLQIMRDAYARFHSILRLPFSHPMTGIRHVVDVPLVASLSTRPRHEILKAIGHEAQDQRPIVFLSLRDGANAESLKRLATRERDILLFHVGDSSPRHPSNLRPVTIGNVVSFADLTSIADVIVGKPGYGMMAACAANRKRFLCVPRVGFREDEVLLQGAARCITIEPLPLSEFENGEWGGRLQDILSKPILQHEIDLDGAFVCANHITKHA